MNARMRWALLFVGVVSIASGCQAYRDRQTIHGFLSQVAPQLRAQPAALGAVVIQDEQIALLDGALTLALRVPHEEDDSGQSYHVHALATPRGRETGGLDICLVGADAKDAGDSLIRIALPPLVSAVRDEPVLGAQHSWSDTPRGIAARSAYVGDFRIRGDTDNPLISRFTEGGAFGNLPQLPRDGRMHLVKVVALAEAGELRRTVELDGATKLEDGQLVGDRAGSAERGAAGSPTVMVAFAVLDGRGDPESDGAVREEARRRLAARPAWLPDPTECPTRRLPAAFVRPIWDPNAARGGRLLHAVRGCEAGAVELCYAAAQDLIHESQTSVAAESLFLRACQLGDASACTNAAAGRNAADECSFETFEAACERGRDPWGCVMLGGALARDAKHRDVSRARQVLPRGCRLADDDPACQAARALLESLDAPAGATP